MKIATILTVGIDNRAVAGELQAHGYAIVQSDSIQNAAVTEDPYALVIIHERLLHGSLEPALERVRFLCENAPVVAFLGAGTSVDGELREAMNSGTVEHLLEEEVLTGLLSSRIDSILLYSRLDTGLHEKQDDLFQKQTLQAELTLRSEVLELQQAVNENILGSMNSGVIILDLQGAVMVCNHPAVKLLGITSAELIGMDYRVVLPEVFVRMASRLLVLRQKGSFPPYRKIPMGRLSLGVSSHRMRDSSGMQNGIMFLIDDITEQEEIAASLQQAERLATVGTMLSGVAHELRNPLAIISARTQRTLAKTDADPEWVKKSLESIQKQSERCAALVNSLLSFARKSTAVLGLHSVEEVLEEALSYAAYDKSVGEIEIRKDYGKGLSMYGDRSRYVQVFLNLIKNATDAMGGPGVLTIACRSDSETTVEICIGDSGPGIDPAVAAKVFDPFFTTKDPGKGTGLGLAIVYKIVSESAGSIRFESIPGTTIFFVRLPARSITRHG